MHMHGQATPVILLGLWYESDCRLCFRHDIMMNMLASYAHRQSPLTQHYSANWGNKVNIKGSSLDVVSVYFRYVTSDCLVWFKIIIMYTIQYTPWAELLRLTRPTNLRKLFVIADLVKYSSYYIWSGSVAPILRDSLH